MFDEWKMTDEVVTVLERHIPGNVDGESANDYREKLELIARDVVSTIKRNLEAM